MGGGEVNQVREGHTPRMKVLSAAKVLERRGTSAGEKTFVRNRT